MIVLRLTQSSTHVYNFWVGPTISIMSNCTIYPLAKGVMLRNFRNMFLKPSFKSPQIYNNRKTQIVQSYLKTIFSEQMRCDIEFLFGGGGSGKESTQCVFFDKKSQGDVKVLSVKEENHQHLRNTLVA